jgi:hypothetical protein
MLKILVSAPVPERCSRVKLYLKCIEEPVKLPVLAHPNLCLKDIQGVSALLSEADGHQEVDDGGELVQKQVEPVRQGSQAPAIY